MSDGPAMNLWRFGKNSMPFLIERLQLYFRAGLLETILAIWPNAHSNSTSFLVRPTALAAALNRLYCSCGSSSGSLGLGMTIDLPLFAAAVLGGIQTKPNLERTRFGFVLKKFQLPFASAPRSLP